MVILSTMIPIPIWEYWQIHLHVSVIVIYSIKVLNSNMYMATLLTR